MLQNFKVSAKVRGYAKESNQIDPDLESMRNPGASIPHTDDSSQPHEEQILAQV